MESHIIGLTDGPILLGWGGIRTFEKNIVNDIDKAHWGSCVAKGIFIIYYLGRFNGEQNQWCFPFSDKTFNNIKTHKAKMILKHCKAFWVIVGMVAFVSRLQQFDFDNLFMGFQTSSYDPVHWDR